MKNDQIDARIREGLEQAHQCMFVPDSEMEEFFAQHVDSSVNMLWVNECMRRMTLIDEGNMQLIEAGEVMNKYCK